MARCTTTRNLEVHHKRKDGGSGLDNAEVLCEPCHKATSSYGPPGSSPPPFSEETKKKALANAGNQCECTRTGGCH
jgi:5-methylcytosine-specific restriction endonuclease McrA